VYRLERSSEPKGSRAEVIFRCIVPTHVIGEIKDI
jgi:hypothetical protein